MSTIINGSSPSITFSDSTTQSSGISSVGGVIQPAGGGTGQTTYTNGQLLIGNTTGNTLTKATLTAGSNITITNGTGSISIAATVPASVTSVATGNGLSGGTITSTGTLSIACPGANTVGSYIYGYTDSFPNSVLNLVYGDNYAVGTSVAQVGWSDGNTAGLSGTWKYLGASYNSFPETGTANALYCKVA
jgi:hypothetical protein